MGSTIAKPVESATLQSRREQVALACDHDRLFRSESGSSGVALRSTEAWAVSAALLWLLGEYDASHEATLGAFNSKGPQLEGATEFVEDLKDPEWVHKHRVCPEQVLLHAALHRLEGPLEADKLSLSGYDNARIWYGRLDPRFQVLEDLVEFAKKHAPKVAARCVVPEGLVHVRKVPVRTPGVQGAAAWAGPGRMVFLEAGAWDPYAFIDVVKEVREAEESNGELDAELAQLKSEALLVQQEELASVFRHATKQAMGGDDQYDYA